MTDQIEDAVTATDLQPMLALGSTGTTVVLAFAAYGAARMTKDIGSFAKKKLNGRKARKAQKESEKAANTPQQ